jgi:hypothetical protein
VTIEFDDDGVWVPHADDIVWVALMPFAKVVSTDSPDEFTRQFAEIPVWAQHLLAAMSVENGVQSSGFSDLFCTNEGVMTPEAVNGFVALGMPRTAEVVRKAIAVFGSSYPREVDRREALADQIREAQADPDADPWAEHDVAYGELAETEAGGFPLATAAYVRGLNL